MRATITEIILIRVTEIYDVDSIVEIDEEEYLIIMNYNDDECYVIIVIKENLNKINIANVEW